MLRHVQTKTTFPFWLFVLMLAMLGAMVVLSFLAVPQLRSIVGLPPADINKLEVTWEMLQTEQLSFLTTARQECRIYLDHEEATWTGGESTTGSIKAAVFYGFDLAKITPDDLEVDSEGVVVIHFPEPEILTLSLDFDSYKAVTKRHGLWKITGVFKDNDSEVQKRLGGLRQQALYDLQQQGRLKLEPLQEGILRFLQPLFEKQGIPFEIQFPPVKEGKMIRQYLRAAEATM